MAKAFGVLKDIAISLGLDVAVLAFKDRVAKTAGTTAGAAVAHEVNDQRAELLDDLAKMPLEDTKNLRRRHRKAMRSVDPTAENRFVTLLCKICKDEKEGRRAVLKYLNDLSDADFDQMLCLLEHDVIAQWVHKAVLTGQGIATDGWLDLKRQIKKRHKAAARRTDHIVGNIAGQLARATNQLNQRQARRQRARTTEPLWKRILGRGL